MEDAVVVFALLALGAYFHGPLSVRDIGLYALGYFMAELSRWVVVAFWRAHQKRTPKKAPATCHDCGKPVAPDQPLCGDCYDPDRVRY